MRYQHIQEKTSTRLGLTGDTTGNLLPVKSEPGATATGELAEAGGTVGLPEAVETADLVLVLGILEVVLVVLVLVLAGLDVDLLLVLILESLAVGRAGLVRRGPIGRHGRGTGIALCHHLRFVDGVIAIGVVVPEGLSILFVLSHCVRLVVVQSQFKSSGRFNPIEGWYCVVVVALALIPSQDCEK